MRCAASQFDVWESTVTSYEAGRSAWRSSCTCPRVAGEDLVAVHHIDARVAGTRETVGITVGPGLVAVLLEPGDRELARRIQIALLLVEHLPRISLIRANAETDRHLGPVGLDHT